MEFRRAGLAKERLISFNKRHGDKILTQSYIDSWYGAGGYCLEIYRDESPIGFYLVYPYRHTEPKITHGEMPKFSLGSRITPVKTYEFLKPRVVDNAACRAHNALSVGYGCYIGKDPIDYLKTNLSPLKISLRRSGSRVIKAAPQYNNRRKFITGRAAISDTTISFVKDNSSFNPSTVEWKLFCGNFRTYTVSIGDILHGLFTIVLEVDNNRKVLANVVLRLCSDENYDKLVDSEAWLTARKLGAETLTIPHYDDKRLLF